MPPSRGLILDRNGVVLAENRPAYQIELVREQVGDGKALDATLAQLVDIGLLRREDVGGDPPHRASRTRLRERADQAAAQRRGDGALRRAPLRSSPGVDIHARLSRHYPLKELAVHALGYVERDQRAGPEADRRAEYAGTSLIGKLGVEGAYEARAARHAGLSRDPGQCRGPPGRPPGRLCAAARTQRAGGRRPTWSSAIDIRVQKVAEEALAGKRGAVVALDPHTGDVIALASTPGFDPNDFVRGLSVAATTTRCRTTSTSRC